MKDKAPRRVGAECLGFTARLLSRVVSGVYDDALAEVGLKVSQFSLLNAIANGEDPRPAELAKSLAMDESTLSRNVARMCARGWLRLESGDGDRRSHQITVTEKGMALLGSSYPAWQKAQRQIIERLGPEGVTASQVGRKEAARVGLIAPLFLYFFSVAERGKFASVVLTKIALHEGRRVVLLPPA